MLVAGYERESRFLGPQLESPRIEILSLNFILNAHVHSFALQICIFKSSCAHYNVSANVLHYYIAFEWLCYLKTFYVM
jgi:hypothetical protein